MKEYGNFVMVTLLVTILFITVAFASYVSTLVLF